MAEQDLLTRIYNAFDPFYPLDVSDPHDASLYVEMKKARGGADIIRDLGKKILRNDQPCTQLYTGHRGTGKSTELLRLKKYLEGQHCRVVYFAADEEDIDVEDAQYTDILIACTRQLLKELKGDQSIFKKWLTDRFQDLVDLGLTKVELQDFKANMDIPGLFTKLSLNIKAVPTERSKIREKLNAHTVTLLEHLQKFIDSASKKLSEGTKLVVIVDNLDRITPILRESGRTNHQEIFIDRSEQLRKLGCDVVYTVPISLAYQRANDLAIRYNGEPTILPITMVKTKEGNFNPEGLLEIRNIIQQRVNNNLPEGETCELVDDVFADDEVLVKLCQMSGGHVRDLLRMIRTAFDYIEVLPITRRAAKIAISKTRNTYRNTITSPEQWTALAQVATTKKIKGTPMERELMFVLCILQYIELDEGSDDDSWDESDEEDEFKPWYDVHPVIRGIEQFKEAMAHGDSE